MRAATQALRVDGYVRVSRVGLRRGERFISPQIQREQIKLWAASRNVQVLKIFEELDAPGRRKPRPQLDRAIERVADGCRSVARRDRDRADLPRVGHPHCAGLRRLNPASRTNRGLRRRDRSSRELRQPGDRRPERRLCLEARAISSDRDLARAQTEGAGLIALHLPRISNDGTHDEHPPARDEMRQVVRQPLDVFAPLLLEALHFDDLGDQHVIGLTDGLSGHVRRPRKAPIRDRVQRPADDVAILRHQTLKVLGQLRRTQLKPNEKGRRRTHPRSVLGNRT
jgi:resolvase-like protein